MRRTDGARALLRVLGACAMLAWAFAANAAAPAPRIGIVTMEPGEIFFERFGHNAVLVDDAAGFAQFLPFVKQQNVEWVLLLLPVHWALLRTLDPKTE